MVWHTEAIESLSPDHTPELMQLENRGYNNNTKLDRIRWLLRLQTTAAFQSMTLEAGLS